MTPSRGVHTCWWCQCEPEKGERLVPFEGDLFHSECLDEYRMFEEARGTEIARQDQVWL